MSEVEREPQSAAPQEVPVTAEDVVVPAGLHDQTDAWARPSRVALGITVMVIVAIGFLAAGPVIVRQALPAPQSSPSAPVEITRDAALSAVRALGPSWQSLPPRDSALIGQSRWIEATAGPGEWTVTVYEGSGDCPAGCTASVTTTYRVGADGVPQLLERVERGDVAR